MKLEKWLKLNTNSLKGKTIAITGSTGGLCKEICLVFASLNANLILINRSLEKSKKQKQEILKLYPNTNIEILVCDLSNLENVKTTTEILKHKEIDIFYIGAAVYKTNVFKTDFGYNNIFTANFLSHYYMVKELLPNLNKRNGKVVAVSSIAYNYNTLNEKDIDFSTHRRHSDIYGNSKRFLMYSIYELLKNETTTLSIVQPGITLTNITNHYPKAINWLVKIGIKLIFPNTKKASLSLIKGAFDITEYSTWIGPKIFNIWGKPKKQKLKKYNINESKKIFNISEDIYNKIKNKK